MRKLILFAAILLTFQSLAKCEIFDFKSYKLNLNHKTGQFGVEIKKHKLLSGMLFFNPKAAGIKDTRYFQDGLMTKIEKSLSIAQEGNIVKLALSGTITNKHVGTVVPFTQTMSILPAGKIQVDYEISAPDNWAFKEPPRLLFTLPMTEYKGKGIWWKDATGEAWKVIDKVFKPGKQLRGQHILQLKVASDVGPLTFDNLANKINFQDTRAYQKKGGLRIDMPGKAVNGKWNIAFTLKLPVDSITVPKNIVKVDVEKFKPDFSTWDIYLPYLKRTHLSGWWKMTLLPDTDRNPTDDQGTKEKFFSPTYDDSNWQKTMVPGDWHRPFMVGRRDTPRKRRTFSGVGWYRLNFNAPELPAGNRAVLHFDEVVRQAEIFLNGKKVGAHTNYRVDGMHATWEGFNIDVTDSLIAGQENVLAVRAYASGQPVMWGWARRGGITGRVYLDIKPAAFCRSIEVTPDNDLKGISYECRVSGECADKCNWRAEVFEWNTGNVVASIECPKIIKENDEQKLKGQITVPNAKLWSCESPFLYGLKIKNKAGDVVGVKRFGMRTFQVGKGQFLLNGKPVMMRGICMSEHDYSRYNYYNGYIFVQNEGNALKRYFKMWRGANINHIRLHTSLMTPVGYDVFDELGFLITDELNYPFTSIKNPKVADKISIQGIDFASEKDGRLRPEFINRVTRRLRHLYSHPSVVTFSFGNEMRGEEQCRKMFNNLYDLYKKLDKQNRPITPSSGRFWKSGRNMAALRKIDKLDYIDTHDYTGSINNWPVAFCQPIAENFMKLARQHYGPNFPPVINGETVYFQDHYYPGFYDEIWTSENDAEPNWKKYLWTLTQLNKKYPAHRMMSYYWVRNWGTRNYKYNQVKGRGIYTERILDVQRKIWPDLDGFELLGGRYFSKMTPVFPLSESQFIPNEAYDSLKQVCAPAVVVLDYVAPNRFCGETLSSVAHIINNTEDDLQNVSLKISIEKNGEEKQAESYNLGNIKQSQKKQLPINIKLPGEPGGYELVYQIKSNDNLLCKRNLELNVNDRQNTFKLSESNKNILVYDAVEKVFTGMGRNNTSKLLNAFGVPFSLIKKFDKLTPDAVLIIGANSFDDELEQNADKIKTFIQNGGRVLVFEQSKMGRIPFLRELELVQAGPGQFAEKIRQYHPALKNINQNELFCWNQPDWSVYHSFVAPLSEAAVLVGGDSTTWGSDNFGMVVAHLKYGKGSLLLSQADITASYKKDSGAAKLAKNLLQTILDDNAVVQAKKYRGKPVLVKPMAENNAVYISLKPVANMGFVDDVAEDGKGGWTDQGPGNDLRKLPTGLQTFGSIPFDILVPQKNNGKSCIVVSGNPKLPFKAKSAQIPVNQKVKRLVFLHTGAWMGNKKAPAGKYIVTYASGKKMDIPLVIGQHIADWWNAPGHKVANAACVWSANNGSSVIGAYAYSWQNPFPNEKIASINVESAGKPVIGLLAITGDKI